MRADDDPMHPQRTAHGIITACVNEFEYIFSQQNHKVAVADKVRANIFDRLQLEQSSDTLRRSALCSALREVRSTW